jgi:hypothetical protein
MKRIALLVSAALVAAALFALAPSKAEAGTTTQYMDPRSSLRYDVVEDVLVPADATDITARVIGAVPPGKHTLKCIVMHQAVAGTGTECAWTVTPKKNGTSLVGTAGKLRQDAGANKSIENSLCPMPDPSNLATVADSFVRPVVSTTTQALSGGELLTMDVDFTGTCSAAPTGVVRLYLEPSH